MTTISTSLPRLAGRHCQTPLNSLHSTFYFSPDFGTELAARGVTDPMGAYLAGRAAPLGSVAAATVTAVFYGFHHRVISRHIPAVWESVSSATVLELRLRAADATLRRVLGAEVIASRELAEAAELALRAVEGCTWPGRPMSAAQAAQPVPGPAHLALWHAATVLREHRGDAHVIALQNAGIGGLEALVSHCASSEGMPKEIVMSKRGWTEEDWSAAEESLRARGFLDAGGALTAEGVRLREGLEEETDRLDGAPYERLGAAGVERLTRLAGELNAVAVASGAFPEALLGTFAKD
ncbi:SCO6745 family protein [Streptomyces roseoverticillatus]|uniref:SCO6745 family protein n=1 Tax=Streptomyces roseoverticillatus TaxID=66429 RepID=UPI0004BF576A|nr:hypothetical protein [Streptomyces roseoverticillatus]